MQDTIFSRRDGRPMRRLAAGLSVLALALAGMTVAAVPARAANDDLAKVLLGITALAIVGAAISNQGKAAPQPQAPRRPERVRHPVALPVACAIRIEGQRAVFYGETCLRRNGVQAQLPQRCARQLISPRASRTVYEGACLQAAGFRIAGANAQQHARPPQAHRPQAHRPHGHHPQNRGWQRGVQRW